MRATAAGTRIFQFNFLPAGAAGSATFTDADDDEVGATGIAPEDAGGAWGIVGGGGVD